MAEEKTPEAAYPEHEKLSAIKDKSQAIYDFLEWCGERHSASLAKPGVSRIEYCWTPIGTSTRDLLAEFFEIDMNKIEDEKRAMLDELRRANEK